MVLFRKDSSKEELRRALAKCNYHTAAEMIAETLGGAIIKKTLASDLQRFCNNPCFEQAWLLIKNNPEGAQQFRDIFMSCCNPNVKVHKLYSLRNEPEFEQMCESIADDAKKHKELKQRLIDKGYSEEDIDREFGKYWSDLAKAVM